jgi:hypothetical protein
MKALPIFFGTGINCVYHLFGQVSLSCHLCADHARTHKEANTKLNLGFSLFTDSDDESCQPTAELPTMDGDDVTKPW